MKNKIIFTAVIVFLFCLFTAPCKVGASICDLSAIRAEYAARGLSGSGMEDEAIDNCLKEQRRLDQQVRDQMQADAENAQKIYEINLAYFYKEDNIEKQLDAINSSDADYLQYRLSNMDCLQSMKIPSDPTTLDSSIFLSLIENKEKCIDYLLKYIKKPSATPIQQPIKSNDQICSDKFGQNWKWISGTICGCKDGYTQRNGDCVSYDQACNIDYLNTNFSKIDGNSGHLVCDCKTGYVWNEQRISCVVPPIIPIKTNDQICQDNYGSNSSWDGTRNNAGGLNCGCKTGYQWNQEQTQCVKIENGITSNIAVNQCVNDVIFSENSLVTKIDDALSKRLSGYILLQTENNGEAWYVNPINQNKYYLQNGPVAYEALRVFGLGITNSDLEKIPVGIESRFSDIDSDGDGLADKLEEGLRTDLNNADTDGDGVSDGEEVLKNNTNPLGIGKISYSNTLIDRLKGRILLQAESRGEAWYVNPKDGKRYYMKDGEAAYQIMRFLSLGITNENLRKIGVGILSE